MLFSVKLLDRFDDASNKDFNALLIRSVLAVVGTLDENIQSDFTTIKSRCQVGAMYIVHFCDFIFVYQYRGC